MMQAFAEQANRIADIREFTDENGRLLPQYFPRKSKFSVEMWQMMFGDHHHRVRKGRAYWRYAYFHSGASYCALGPNSIVINVYSRKEAGVAAAGTYIDVKLILSCCFLIFTEQNPLIPIIMMPSELIRILAVCLPTNEYMGNTEFTSPAARLWGCTALSL